MPPLKPRSSLDYWYSHKFNVVYFPPPNNPHIPSSAEMKEGIGGNIAATELLKNVLYLFAVGCLIGFAIRKIVLAANEKLRRHGITGPR